MKTMNLRLTGALLPQVTSSILALVYVLSEPEVKSGEERRGLALQSACQVGTNSSCNGHCIMDGGVAGILPY